MNDEKKQIAEHLELTPEEIRELDEISSDKDGVKTALRVAQNYAANALSRLRRKEKKWWKDVMQKRGVPLHSHYVAEIDHTIPHIREATEQEKMAPRDAIEGWLDKNT